jgi:hypothetical protein
MDGLGPRFTEGRTIGHGALARRFFDIGKLRRAPELVPASAWIDGLSDSAWIQEHSMQTGKRGAVLTILWAPHDPDRPRRITLPPRLLPTVRDLHLSDDVTQAAGLKRTFRNQPCPYAPTWLDALLRSRLRAAG